MALVRVRSLGLLLLVPFFLIALSPAQNSAGNDWPTYGGDPGGTRYSQSKEITPANVAQLKEAWVFRTGDLHRPGLDMASFEATPILFHGLLYLSSPYDQVFALDPATGRQEWSYDPGIASGFISRGVAAWPLPGANSRSSGPCAARIFIATADARLIALDALTGKPCADFGQRGSVDLTHVVGYGPNAHYHMTSPPTVIGDLVVVGSSIGDNQAVEAVSGAVRAFDVHSGRLVWSWEPLPWAQNQHPRTGAGNAWNVIAADPEHNLVFVPTGAPSPDFYGGLRRGDDRDANSVVALEGTTGRRVWGFQIVHHDLWDYDIAAEPLLFNFRGKIPAVAITTKQGLVFVLNRLTGEPLFPVAERAVPASDLPGETAWPTQPFQQIDSLSPLELDLHAHFGATERDDKECHKIIDGLRYDGIYTPPSTKGSLEFPGSVGGVNWGSAAFDPVSGLLYANTNRYAFSVTLIPRTFLGRWAWRFKTRRSQMIAAIPGLFAAVLALIVTVIVPRSVIPRWIPLALCAALLVCDAVWILKRIYPIKPTNGAEHFQPETAPQVGAPYMVHREPLVASSGHPCTPTPWGTVSALNLNTGKSAWQVPLGTLIEGQQTGTVNVGGDLVTAGGLLFTAASEQPLLRAFDSSSGREVWQGTLPVPAQATPMSYTFGGRQYIVIAAGGHGMFGTAISDAVVAFALPSHVQGSPQ